MSKSNKSQKESLEIKSWQTKTLFICQYSKRRRLTSRQSAERRLFWIPELDFEGPEASKGVHFIANQ